MSRRVRLEDQPHKLILFPGMKRWRITVLCPGCGRPSYPLPEDYRGMPRPCGKKSCLRHCYGPNPNVLPPPDNSSPPKKLIRTKHERHGFSGSRIYNTWSSMRHRCANPSNIGWKRYGGRGIRVCDEWQQSFVAFKDWAFENGYTDGLTIDRIDRNGHYCPENCQWLTREDNSSKAFRRYC